MLVSSSARLVASHSAVRPACAVCHSQKRYAHKLVEVELIQDVPALGLRGTRLPVSPGTARNRLIPNNQALYVGRDGQVVAPLRRLLRKEAERAGGLAELLAKERKREAERRAKAVLDGLSGAADPHAAAREAEQTLHGALALLPSPALTFSRLTTSPTSSDLFGSVSSADVVSALKEQHALSVDAAHGVFVEGEEGVEKGRVKQIGEFTFVVGLKTIGRDYPIRVRVVRA
ncbi:hypothetical protein JCM10207_008301 [Rhodosporidiobolus poonsookiae]